MVSETLVKLSSPVARSCLIALSVCLLVDAVLTIYAASQYPYLIDSSNDLYIVESKTISFVYIGFAAATILIAISTAFASYKNASNYVLIHSGITGIFLPVSILVYFSTTSARYKVGDYVDDYRKMIAEYRTHDSKYDNQASTEHTSHSLGGTETEGLRNKLNIFVNLIDSIQSRFSCCGIDSVQDWINRYNGYISPTCCAATKTKAEPSWSTLFKVDANYEFRYCDESESYHIGCLVALKEDEHSKYAWLSDLVVFAIVITIANTVVALLLFGLTKTEETSYEGENVHELSIVGVSSKPRLSQPTIMSIKPRPSVVHTLGASRENISNRAQAVRFNLGSTPRSSISGPSKFSAAARRGSSFI